MRSKLSWAASAALVLAGPAAALPADFKAKADALLAESFPADGPGAIVLVTEKGRAAYASGRGLADVEAGKPLDPAMPMRLGSITKQFTAAMVLKLAEEGRLSLDDPLSKFLPDYPQPGAAATVRQLLNHTSGIRSYTGIPGVMISRADKKHSTSDMIALFRHAPPEFAAGKDWAYNNSGYVLLGAIIEQVTRKPWYAALNEEIIRPLGLRSIRYGGLENGEKGIAKPYTRQGDKVVPALPIDMSFPHAAGALVGTTADLSAWARALHQGKVIGKASYSQMIAPTKIGDRTVPYGYGLAPGKVRGRNLVGHDGGIYGFQTDGIYLPAEDIYVAVFANSDQSASDPEIVSRKLAALAVGDPFEELKEAPLNAQAVEPFLGVYRTADAERTFFLKNGKLFTKRKGNSALPVLPAVGNRFFYPDSLTWFAIERGADGMPVMQFHTDGERAAVPAVYAGPVPPEPAAVALPRADLERLAGNYQGPLPIVVGIDEKGQLTLKFGPQPITHLIAESPTMFRVEEVDAKVEFKLDGGKASELLIHQGGRALPAKRKD
ncbi:serine hydrolase [Sphingomonas sp. HDW15A]|uniref:serine hydrolase n=1 Tax=Sphingomonas sp. HDW15A TaxID=2714942 RepID=UPI00140AFC2B|nr:serine hydrolase [Sphingomonas sp. HDW15A]QIK95306.1 serine hydrolase [Sphingomonas sp. HDW15A]